MPIPSDLRTQAERSLIACDARFFLDLALNPRLEPIRPTAFLMLMPFMSAFLYESIRYTKREKPESLRELHSHQDLLRASRMRMKLLDGDPRTLDELLTEADELVAVVKNMFMRDHRGVLGPLKRLLQKDVGIHFIRDEVVGTHHVALLNAGITPRTLSGMSWDGLDQYLYDTSGGVGTDTAQLLSELGILQSVGVDSYPSESATGQPLSPPQYCDRRSEVFYGSVARQAAPGRDGVGVILTSILSQVNTARVLVPLVAAHNEIAAFKIRLVSLFHAAVSLQNLLDKDRRTPFLHPDAVQRLRAILGTDVIRRVRRRKALRHNFVHYRIEDHVAERLSPGLPLSGLVEALTSGDSLAATADEVNIGLDLVSDGLFSLLPQPLTPEGTL
jgi:hypothetical protein